MKMTRWLSLVLAAMMALGMCSFASAEAAPFPTAEPTLPAEWKPFDSKVTITVPVYDRSKEGYPAVDDNYWTKWIQAEFGDKWNIDVKYVAIPRGDVMTKYSLLIAANDTPTIMMEYDYPKVAQWANDGAMKVIDLEQFKAVAPTYYQKMVDNNQLGYTDINGQTYFVLSERPYYNEPYTYYTYVRMDWLRQVGYDHVPETYAEKVDAINKIKAAGLSEYPLPLGLPASAYITNFGFRDFPADEKEWVMHSSLGTPGFTSEATKRLLKRQNAEYNMGWYNPEFDLSVIMAGATATQDQTDFINGKTYQYGGYMGTNVSWLTAFFDQNPGAELALTNPNDAVEEGVCTPTIRSDNPFGMIVGFSSYASEDQLKAAWMLMEWMIQPEVLYVLENGVENVTFTIGEDGLPVVNGDYRGPEMLNHNNNIDMVCLVHASKVNGTVEQSIAAVTPQGLPQNFYDLMIKFHEQQHENVAKGFAYSDPIFAVAIESESEYSATLLSLYQGYFSQLTKCAPEEFDALYEKCCQEFLEAGYQEIIDERLAAYEAGNTTKLPANVKK